MSIRATLVIALIACAVLPLVVFGAPGDAPEAEIPAVGAKLRSGSSAERRSAAEAVLYGRGLASTSELSQAAAKERDPETKVRLLKALGNQGDEAAVKALGDVLRRDPLPLARMVAAKQLRRLRGGDGASDALIQALKNDKDADVRSACASALGSYPSPESAKALADAAKDQDPRIRRDAALGLTEQPKTPEGEAALNALEKDPDPVVAAKTRAWRGKKAPGKSPAKPRKR